MKWIKKAGKYFYFLSFGFLFQIKTVYAYIDPSVMTYAIQAIAGVAIGLGAFFGIFYRQVKRKLISYLNVEETSKIYEKNDIYFCDENNVKKIAKINNKVEDKKKNKSGIVKFLPIVFMAIACGMLFFCAPLDIFFANQDDFWFDFRIIIPAIIQSVLIGIVFIGGVLLTFMFINKKIYKMLLVLASIVLITTYIQGNFLCSTLPIIDGETIDWNEYGFEMFQSITLLLVIGAIHIYIVNKISLDTFEKLSVITSSIMIIILIASFLAVGISTNGFADNHCEVISSKDQYLMSTDKNLIILVVDSVDASEFDKVINDNPRYKEKFTDFTFYTNTMSAYPYTVGSLPFIIGAQYIEDDETIVQYNKRNIENSKLLNTLEKDNYQLGVYSPSINLNEVKTKNFINSTKENITIKKRQFCINIYKLCWYKYAPYYLKGIVNPNEIEFDWLMKIKDNDEYQTFSDDNIIFYNSVLNTSITKTYNKQFKLIHFNGAHTPFKYTPEVELIEKEEKGTYYMNVQASITIVDAYLNKLKKNGVYDNSIIIILADHGFNEEVDPVEHKRTATGRQHPFMLIKGINESHELVFNDAPVAFSDLQEAYKNLLDGKLSQDAFSIKEGEIRERTYYFYRNYKDYYEVQISKGHARDTDALKDTGIRLKRR